MREAMRGRERDSLGRKVEEEEASRLAAESRPEMAGVRRNPPATVKATRCRESERERERERGREWVRSV